MREGFPCFGIWICILIMFCVSFEFGSTILWAFIFKHFIMKMGFWGKMSVSLLITFRIQNCNLNTVISTFPSYVIDKTLGPTRR